jgi:hypothetical protein
MKILDKLRKLINHERSARAIGNLAEAKAFAEKIQELLDHHNLSHADIPDNAEPIPVGVSWDNVFKSVNDWQEHLILNLARLNSCDIVKHSRGILLVGAEEDRLIVTEIYVYFTDLGQIFAEKELKNWKTTREYKLKHKKVYYSKLHKKSFLFGFVHVLVERFKEKHAAAKAACNNEKALVFIGNKLANNKAWIAENCRTYERETKRTKVNVNAYNQGRLAGRQVALTTKTVSNEVPN